MAKPFIMLAGFRKSEYLNPKTNKPHPSSKYVRENKKKLFYIQIHHKLDRNTKFVHSTGHSVVPMDWDFDKSCYKSHVPNALTLNTDILKEINRVHEAYLNVKNNDYELTPNEVKKEYDNLKNQSVKKNADKKTLFERIQFIIDNPDADSKEGRSPGTIRHYKVLSNHLKAFNKRLDYHNINSDFYVEFKKYLQTRENPISDNYFNRLISRLKAVMSIGAKKDGNTNNEFKEFVSKCLESESIALNEEQIQDIFDIDFKSNKILTAIEDLKKELPLTIIPNVQSLERVRDISIIGFCTGLRHSDFTRAGEYITKENGKMFIKITTQKTGDDLLIPFHPMVEQIYNNYGKAFPRPISQQKYNDYIKIVCRLARLNQKVKIKKPLISSQKATKKSNDYEEFPLYEMISSHTCRRSFCTNLYRKGFPAIYIMQISGHTTEKAFLRYIKIDKKETADKLQQLWSTEYTSVLKAV